MSHNHIVVKNYFLTLIMVIGGTTPSVLIAGPILGGAPRYESNRNKEYERKQVVKLTHFNQD